MATFFEPSVVKREAPKRGPMSSSDYNTFQDQVVADLSRISRALNDLGARYNLKILELEEERRKIAALVEHFRTQKKLEDRQKAVLAETIRHYNAFRDLDGLLWTGISASRSLRIETVFGQAILPFNRCVSRFGSKNPVTDDLSQPSTLEVTATAVDEGSGTNAGDVKAGTPKLCVDSLSAEPWIRKVLFPMESDQAEVVMDVDITVPSLYASDANLLSIIPSPAGEVDIVDVKYSTTSAAPSTQLPGFTAKDNVTAMRIHFADLPITKLRIRLRQRHFVFEEAEKVFLYGLKEVGAFLVEWDKTTSSGAGTPSIQQNNTAIFKVSAPSGYKFNQIKSFVSNPTFGTSGSPNGIYFRIYGNEALTQLRWDSYADTTPTSASPLSLSAHNLTSLYVVVYLEYDSTNKKSPVVESWYFDYTTLSV